MQLIVKIQNSLPPFPKGEFGKTLFSISLLNKMDDDTLHYLPLPLSKGDKCFSSQRALATF